MNENEKKAFNAIDIDLWKIVQHYLRNWWVIACCALVFAGGALFYTANFITPQYQTSVTIYVNSTTRTDKQDYVNAGELSTASRIVSTYTNMISSDTVLEHVIEATGLDYTAAQLRGLISSTQVGGTEIFKVNVRHTNPVTAAQIANAIAQAAPEAIAEFVDGSSTKIIDYAKVPTSRFTPDYSHNTLMGFGIGAGFAVLLLTLQSLLDVRIKDENDLADLFDYPVLGQIPDMEQSSNKHSYGKSGYYASYTQQQGKGEKK